MTKKVVISNVTTVLAKAMIKDVMASKTVWMELTKQIVEFALDWNSNAKVAMRVWTILKDVMVWKIVLMVQTKTVAKVSTFTLDCVEIKEIYSHTVFDKNFVKATFSLDKSLI